jgi:hypothetical protein
VDITSAWGGGGDAGSGGGGYRNCGCDESDLDGGLVFKVS